MAEQPTPWWLALIQVIISWQVVVLIAFLSLRKWIISLFTKEHLKIKAGPFELDLSKPAQEQATKFIEEKSILEKTTNIFRDETMSLFKTYIQDETNYTRFYTDKEKFEALLKYSITIYIIYRFQSIYDLIFGSQIYLLQNLNSHGLANQDILAYHYNPAKIKYPEIYENYSLDDWTAFLLNFNLISKLNDNRIEMTSVGIDFLKYITEARKNLYKDF